MPSAAGATKEFQALAPWIGGIFTVTGGCDRWMVVGDAHWMCGDGGVWGGAGSREARYGRGRYESGTMHRAALMCTFSRFISTFPRSESNPRFRFHRGVPCWYHRHRIHGSGTSRGSYCQHPSTPRGLCSARENSTFVVSGTWPVDTSLPRRRRTRGRENQRGQSLPREAPCRWAKHSQIAERRARIHPPSRPSPSGEGAQRAGSVNPRRAFTHPCPIPERFPGSTSPSLGVWQTHNRATMVRGSIPVAGRRCALKTPSLERPSGSSFAETSALSSLWPIALATPDGRSSARCRPPALGRRKLRREASSLFYVAR